MDWIRGPAIALAAFVAAVGCGGSAQPPLLPNPGEDCMGGAVLVAPSLAELSVGDSVLATAHRLSFIAKCFPNAGSVFDWTSQKPELVRITRLGDSTAYLTALGPGIFQVFATIRGGDTPGPLSATVEMRIR